MMKDIAVIYSSKYGTTQKYAAWIAAALQADLLEKSAVKPAQLAAYDIIVYGGGLYAGGISGVELVAKNPPKKLVVFTVGLADPQTTDYSAILQKNLGEELLSTTKAFHLRGGIDYAKLGPLHKGMMAMMKRMVGKKPPAERTEEDRKLLETYGGQADFTDQAAIAPLVDYVRALQL